MVYALAWLPTVLRDAGCVVVETIGWQMRGHGDFSTPKGVLIHHTAGPLEGNIPSLKTLIQGRGAPNPLAGPLCNLGLARDGTFYVIAAGLAYHAGPGMWEGVGQYHVTELVDGEKVTRLIGTMDGNAHFIGIECENTGLPNDPWPSPQMDALRKGVTALRSHIGAPVCMIAGHKEFAMPLGRKCDPSFDCAAFRASLAPYMQPALVA